MDIRNITWETVGLPNEELSLMKEIKSTGVKSAWICKKETVAKKIVKITRLHMSVPKSWI